MNNTILLNVRSQNEKDHPLYSASTPITPGMFVQFHTGTNKVEPHSTATGVPAPLMIAVEMPIRSGSGIDDAYDTVEEVVACLYPLSGDRLYSFVEAGSNIAIGDLLESAGDGTLQEGSTGPIARATEAVDNSAGYTAARIKVEVL